MVVRAGELFVGLVSRGKLVVAGWRVVGLVGGGAHVGDGHEGRLWWMENGVGSERRGDMMARKNTRRDKREEREERKREEKEKEETRVATVYQCPRRALQ